MKLVFVVFFPLPEYIGGECTVCYVRSLLSPVQTGEACCPGRRRPHAERPRGET